MRPSRSFRKVDAGPVRQERESRRAGASGAAAASISLFGAYAVRRNLGDVIVAVAIGVLMYLGIKLRFDPASAVLGLVLGPIAETNIVLSIRAAQAHGQLAEYFLTRPISVFFIVLIVLSIAATGLQRRRSRRTVVKDEQELHAEDARWGKRNVSIGVGIVAFAALAYLPMHGEPWEHSVWPIMALGVLALLGVLLVLQGIGQRRRSTKSGGRDGDAGRDTLLVTASARTTNEGDTIRSRSVHPSGTPASAPADKVDSPRETQRRPVTGRMAFTLGAVVVYTCAAIFLGFYEATFLFLIGMTFLVNRDLLRSTLRRRLMAVLYAAITVAALFFAFERFMRILMPSTLL
jgi:hypothetical protein